MQKSYVKYYHLQALNKSMTYFRTLLLSLFLFSGLLPVAMAASLSYTLSSGDVISIQVYGEPDLSFERILLTDSGRISYPFLGELATIGKTPKALEKEIVTGLKNGYLKRPKVTVSIIEYRDFFMRGEVKNPGGYPYKPGLTVHKAIALAGGLTERASEGKMFLIKDGQPDQKPSRVKMRDKIGPGDIITIEQSFF